MLLPSLFRNGRRLADYVEDELRDVDHPAARALVRRRALRGSAPDGAWLPRDHRRAVLAGVLVLLVGWSLAMWCFDLADARAGTPANSVLTGVGIFLLFGSSYASWHGLKHVRGALRRTPRAPAS